ncbi:uncharacterized protein A1O5_03021 [Cladophialophora psammophila CBS 110553]|uniref:Heterokaryon incompatibility domain-containing protein n=1 Tax=Cladophialophora psammophila CBS 110553 TaxID=1182543 RepID=W9X8K9_9EURO|nr:uncharacterized protein A1O5_03021 [Cladophialophora psammophila CBS 110553]EXJ73261.1 hypothetical protein A1O5_03021 [Cladophialophora psammophila CBS 110553]
MAGSVPACQRGTGFRSAPTGNSSAFSSLVDRSIQAWATLNYANLEVDKASATERHAEKLRSLNSIDDLLLGREYWFFQSRESFLRQERLMKWSSSHLDQYVLFPIDYGFVNNKDCFFVSHYWRTSDHPDPDGVDLRMFIQDLKDAEWSYIWVDWTCMPQYDDGARTRLEEYYFRRMLTCIPMLVRDCAMAWRYPSFEPRAWILYEVAEYVLNHREYVKTPDNSLFIQHIVEMLAYNVRQVLDIHKYRCTNKSDMLLVTGWLEILKIVYGIFPDDVQTRQEVLDQINQPYTGTYANPSMDLKIDKVKGEVHHRGKVYSFTPVFHLAVHTSLPLLQNGAT